MAGANSPAFVYLYAVDRRGQHVRQHLAGFHGVLQVDGYAGYDKLAASSRPGGAIILAYCLAHVRREFFDEHKKTSGSVAAEALRRIGEVYAIEARIRGLTADARVAIRQAETKPLMVALKRWLMVSVSRWPPVFSAEFLTSSRCLVIGLSVH
jgi:transposase